MSVKVSSWVWHDLEVPLAGNELVFMLALADIADDAGRCRFAEDESGLTYDALAVKARVSKRTIIRLVESLRDGGLIEHAPGAKGRPNGFRLLVPWAEKSGDKLSPNDSDSVTTATLFGVNDDTRSSLKRINVSSPTKGHRIRPNWEPSKLLLTWAESAAPSIDLVMETAQFVDYWLSKSGAAAVKVDWDATWRTWMRRAHADRVSRGWTPQRDDDGEEWMRR